VLSLKKEFSYYKPLSRMNSWKHLVKNEICFNISDYRASYRIF